MQQEAALERWVAPYEVGDKKFISYDEDLKQVRKNITIKTGVITMHTTI